jgi:hypothetical protein
MRAVVEIRGIKQGDRINYESLLTPEYDAFLYCPRVQFENEDDMITIMNDILSTQKKEWAKVNSILDKIKPGKHSFSGLELTDKQAESLGWNLAKQK